MKNSRGQRPGILRMDNYSATPAIDASTSVDDNVLIPEVPYLTYLTRYLRYPVLYQAGPARRYGCRSSK